MVTNIKMKACVHTCFSAVCVFQSTKEHQVILLDKEIESYKKSTTEEQDKNETLTLQLNRNLMDVTTSGILISQKQAQYEALQAEYSICSRSLSDSEKTLDRLTKVERGQSLLCLCRQSFYSLSLDNYFTHFLYPQLLLLHSRQPSATRLNCLIRGGSLRKRMLCVWIWRTRSWPNCGRSSPTTRLPSTPKS